MKDTIPSNVISGICMNVLDLDMEDLRLRKKNKAEINCDKDKDKIPEKDKEEKSAKKNGMFSTDKISLCIAEFLGTALLLFLGCMGCVTEYEGFPVPHHMPSVSFGLTVMLIIQMFGHISGAHLNPQVTLVTVICGILDKSAVPAYLIGQFAGAIFGLGALKLLIPEKYTAQDVYNAETNETTRRLGLCTTQPHADITTMQGLVLETVITCVLILICCAIWDKRNEAKADSVPLRFGFAIACIGMSAGPFSGGSMNTARSFAPAVLNGDWTAQWIYWVGPTTGALIGSFLYKSLFALPEEEEPIDMEPMEDFPLRKVTAEEKS